MSPRSEATRYMVDTNVFDSILDGTMSISAIDGPLFSTSIQRNELEAIPDVMTHAARAFVAQSQRPL